MLKEILSSIAALAILAFIFSPGIFEYLRFREGHPKPPRRKRRL